MTLWNLMVAVTEDLYTFARESFIRALSVERSKADSAVFALKEPIITMQLVAREEAELPTEHVEEEGENTFRKTAEIIAENHARPEKNTVMYTGAEQVALFAEPTIIFDGVTARIPYGSLIMVLESRGRWSKIVYKNQIGWVLRDELADRSAHVYPEFTIGEANLSDDPNTLRARAVIEDEFAGGVAELPLQSSEYVLYKLYRKGLRITWPEKRPRKEGVWHELLRGVPGIHVGIQPEVGAIMEYVLADGQGHVAYVEAVYPDETISISEANFPNSGIYNERVLTKEEWRELGPIYLTIR